MNHIDYRYISNPWAKFNNRWWLHWFKLNYLWYDICDCWERAFKGYAKADIFNLDQYHCGITLGLLEYYRQKHTGYMQGLTEEEYEAKLDLIIDGFKAHMELLHEEDEKTLAMSTEKYVIYDENRRKNIQQRFNLALDTLKDIYPSLWQ